MGYYLDGRVNGVVGTHTHVQTADERLLPGRVPAEILEQWRYEEDKSRALSARDRSAIYGGFHL